MGKKNAANPNAANTNAAAQADEIARFKIAANLKVLQRQDSSVLGARKGVDIVLSETSTLIRIVRGDGLALIVTVVLP